MLPEPLHPHLCEVRVHRLHPPVLLSNRRLFVHLLARKSMRSYLIYRAIGTESSKLSGPTLASGRRHYLLCWRSTMHWLCTFRL